MESQASQVGNASEAPSVPGDTTQAGSSMESQASQVGNALEAASAPGDTALSHLADISFDVGTRDWT